MDAIGSFSRFFKSNISIFPFAHHKSKPVFGDFSAFSASNPSCFTNKRRIHKIAVQYTCSASGDGPAVDALGFVLDFLENINVIWRRAFCLDQK